MGLLGADGQPMSLQLSTEGSAGGSERVLVVTEAEQTFEFQGVTQRPLPSLLRGFSAPVRLEYPYSRQQLAFLMAHDRDDFNRWDAGQKLAMELILELIAEYQAGNQLVLDPALIEAYSVILRDADSDPAFVAEALSLPGEAYIAEQMQEVDVDAIHAVRIFIQKTLAGGLKESLMTLWQALSDKQKVYTLDAEAMGERRLKNLCLSYLVTLEEDELVHVAVKQFESADNMTDSMGALHALNHAEHIARDQCLKVFHDRWQTNTLVMDKWFGLQAMSQRRDTLERVVELMGHPLFSMKNPNKVRALIGAFAQANPTGFHRKDGAGYWFLAERVKELDAMNPQIAARLVKAFGRWRRYDANRQDMMQKELQGIMAHDGLSQDVYEIVAKSLA
jgi:aminopeptidase N